MDVDGTVVTVFVTHLEVADSRSRVAQAEALTDIASRTPTPRIIMGDFNATPTHALETALMLREHNDAYALDRVLVDSRWLAAQGPFERDYLKGGHTIGVFDPSARIDYIFASLDIGVVDEIGAAGVPRSPASDHLPYVVTLKLPRRQAGKTGSAGGERSRCDCRGCRFARPQLDSPAAGFARCPPAVGCRYAEPGRGGMVRGHGLVL